MGPLELVTLLATVAVAGFAIWELVIAGHPLFGVFAGLFAVVGVGDWWLLRREWPDARPVVDRLLYAVLFSLSLAGMLASALEC